MDIEILIKENIHTQDQAVIDKLLAQFRKQEESVKSI
jgi:hypothetical protein